MHFPGERVLGVHQIIRETCEPLSNPTILFGRFMYFRATRTQAFSVCFYLQEKGGLGKRQALSSGQLESHWQSWEKNLVS